MYVRRKYFTHKNRFTSIDPQVLATVTAWAARLNVLATDMRVEQRSLEDVFLDLTGRELRS